MIRFLSIVLVFVVFAVFAKGLDPKDLDAYRLHENKALQTEKVLEYAVDVLIAYQSAEAYSSFYKVLAIDLVKRDLELEAYCNLPRKYANIDTTFGVPNRELICEDEPNSSVGRNAENLIYEFETLELYKILEHPRVKEKMEFLRKNANKSQIHKFLMDLN